MKEKNIWKRDIRRLSLLKQNLSRSNKMKWMLLRKSLRQISTKGLNLEKLNTISFYRDIKMWRKKLKTNKTLKELSLKKYSKVKKLMLHQDQVQQHREVWWHQRWDQGWRVPKWVQVLCKIRVILHPSLHIWNEENETDKFHKNTRHRIYLWKRY